ncbi:hypothetical protein NQ318_005166 [Aromia moschata]|uniref:Centrosomal protein CCDC61 n=1 Tax=Aromia moschata TaxID=1265417 RepID=A0AAV8XHJ1_9CUCU|nr:hypothetical protein NQ318_005166 [Aromia moschata]
MSPGQNPSARVPANLNATKSYDNVTREIDKSKSKVFKTKAKLHTFSHDMADPNLVTTCTFHGQEYLFKMNILCNNLEILITDKNSGEEWQCGYDATYIENLTQKTGNFKQFDIFVAMIKSGLLRTSESVTLDLLTFEDLELLRSRKLTKTVGPSNSNRRYLIVTYIVEFDKIRYPLPLEYCGPPDPVILQATIRRLELELSKTKEELALKASNSEARKIYFLQKRVDELTEENVQLQEEVRHLSKLLEKKPKTHVVSLQKAVSNLERCVVSERNSHHELVERLRNDKEHLARELEKVKCSEKNLKAKLTKVVHESRMGIGDQVNRTPLVQRGSYHSIRMMYKRSKSPFSEGCCDSKNRTYNHKVEMKKSQPQWEQPRGSKSVTKMCRSRNSSSSSTKYVDPDDFPSHGKIRTPSPTPRRSKRKIARSRCSSVDSRTSSVSSKGSPRRFRKGELDYKKLEEKIVELQKMLKNNAVCDKE